MRQVGIGGQPQRAVDRHAQRIAQHDVGRQPLPEQLAEQRHVGETTDHDQRRLTGGAHRGEPELAPGIGRALQDVARGLVAGGRSGEHVGHERAGAARRLQGARQPGEVAVPLLGGAGQSGPRPAGLAGAQHRPERLAADPGAAAVVTEPRTPPVHGRTPSARVDTERHRPGAHREHGPGRPAEGAGVRDHHVGGDGHPAPGERVGEQPGEAIGLLRCRHRPGRADAHRGGSVAGRRGDHPAYRVERQLDTTGIGEPGGTRALRRRAVGGEGPAAGLAEVDAHEHVAHAPPPSSSLTAYAVAAPPP